MSPSSPFLFPWYRNDILLQAEEHLWAFAMKVVSRPCCFSLLTISTVLQAVFEVYPVVSGNEDVKFAWQKSSGHYIAVTGLEILNKMHCL